MASGTLVRGDKSNSVQQVRALVARLETFPEFGIPNRSSMETIKVKRKKGGGVGKRLFLAGGEDVAGRIH